MKFFSAPFALLVAGIARGVVAHFGSDGRPQPGPARIITNCTRPNTVALTFDDGPYIYQRDLINTLNKARVKGTFFVNGNLYDCIYKQEYVDSMRFALASGHQIGSHTWAHLDLTTLNETQLISEFARTDEALRKTLGLIPAFIRPPYLSVNDLVQQVAGRFRQTIVNINFEYVDLRTGSSADWTGATAEEILERYKQVAEERPRSIVSLGHEPLETTVYGVVEEAIRILKNAGYSFATVAECNGLNPYNSYMGLLNMPLNKRELTELKRNRVPLDGELS